MTFWKGMAAISVAALVACESDEPKDPAADGKGSGTVVHIEAGTVCTEYRDLDVELPLAQPGPCPERENSELCATCTASGAWTFVIHWWSDGFDCASTFDSSAEADVCEVGFGGTFEPIADGVVGPSGATRPEILPGAANDDLGEFLGSIPGFQVVDGVGQLVACTNYYGDPNGVLFMQPPQPHPCPDENRCHNCVITVVNNSTETISYSATDPDCSQTDVAVENCERVGGQAIVYSTGL